MTESVQDSYVPDKVYMGQLDVPETGVEVNISDAAFTVSDIVIEGEQLMGTVSFLDNAHGQILKSILDNIVFRPNGTGVLEKDGNVTDYTLVSFSALMKTDAA
jgi:hypothetical protein